MKERLCAEEKNILLVGLALRAEIGKELNNIRMTIKKFCNHYEY